MDCNQNGSISKHEFFALIQRGKDSGADTSLFHKIANSEKVVVPIRQPQPSHPPSPPSKQLRSLSPTSPARGASLKQRQFKPQQPKEKTYSSKQKHLSSISEEDKLTGEEVLSHLTALVEYEASLKEGGVAAVIEGIFNKVQRWKDRMGDQAEQAVKVAEKLKPKSKVDVLNVKTLYSTMNELKGEIGLADKEVRVIIFTSLDQDHLTNLVCLPGEFVKWMTINFAGEGRVELDFRASKLEIWTATLALSKEVLKAAEKHNDKKFILEHKWWNAVRYHRIGNLIANRLRVNSALKDSLRVKF